MKLAEPLLVDDTSRELDLTKVSHDAMYLSARMEYAIGKAVGRVLFWFAGVPAAVAVFAFVLGLVLRK